MHVRAVCADIVPGECLTASANVRCPLRVQRSCFQRLAWRTHVQKHLRASSRNDDEDNVLEHCVDEPWVTPFRARSALSVVPAATGIEHGAFTRRCVLD